MKNELTLKQFCVEVEQKTGYAPKMAYQNMHRGLWPWPKLKRINQRVVLVMNSVSEYLNKLSLYKP